jgi:hypothetical protein
MFRPYKWAIIRLLVEPKGGGQISSYIILWGSGLLMLYVISGYYVESSGIYI